MNKVFVQLSRDLPFDPLNECGVYSGGKWRGVLWSLPAAAADRAAGGMLSCGGDRDSTTARSAGRRMAMRILSYNIHKGIGGRDRRYRLQRILDVIAAENPDVVCLQEVDRNVRRSNFDHQPERIAEAFGAVGRMYQFNVTVQTGGYGNLLLTRSPLLEQHQISLTLRGRKPRGAQIAVLTASLPAGWSATGDSSAASRIRVVNWHLGLAEKERHWQVRRLLEHHLFRGQAELPTVIIGDYNDWRNTLHRGPFAVHHFQQATTPPSRFRSFPAWMPLGSLDKVFHTPNVVIEHIRLPKTPLTRTASDHLPLVVDLRLK